MAELLLELFSEEIPARMQDRAREDLARGCRPTLLDGGRSRLRSAGPLVRDPAPAHGRRHRTCRCSRPTASSSARARGRTRRSRRDAGFLREPWRARLHARGARGQEGPRSCSRSIREQGRAISELLAELLPALIAALAMAEVDALGRRRVPLGAAAAVDPVPARRRGRAVRGRRRRGSATAPAATASWRPSRSRSATSPTMSSSCARPR